MAKIKYREEFGICEGLEKVWYDWSIMSEGVHWTLRSKLAEGHKHFIPHVSHWLRSRLMALVVIKQEEYNPHSGQSFLYMRNQRGGT